MQSSLSINKQLLLSQVSQRSFERLKCTLISEIKAEILAHLLSFLDELVNFLLTELVFLGQHSVEFLEMLWRERCVDASSRHWLHRSNRAQEIVSLDGLVSSLGNWAVQGVKDGQLVDKINIELLQVVDAELRVLFGQTGLQGRIWGLKLLH